MFYLLLLIAGIMLVLGWGVLFGIWADIGVYSVAVLLVSFGIFGLLFYS